MAEKNTPPVVEVLADPSDPTYAEELVDAVGTDENGTLLADPAADDFDPAALGIEVEPPPEVPDVPPAADAPDPDLLPPPDPPPAPMDSGVRDVPHDPPPSPVDPELRDIAAGLTDPPGPSTRADDDDASTLH